MPRDEDDWAEHKLLILDRLKRLESWLEGVDRKANRLGRDVAVLKTKAGLWGVIGGALAVIIWLLSGVVTGRAP